MAGPTVVTSSGSSVNSQSSAELSKKELNKILIAACCGTVIEWYDFFVFGTIATIVAPSFYKTGTGIGDTIAWLIANLIGFIVRPFGALVFGLLGDWFGRKYIFLVTLLLMGLGSGLVGFLPTMNQLDANNQNAGAILLVFLRIVQGLAIGGEYGGAATYVAESCPPKQRGYYTSFIQATATLGMLLSICIVAICKASMSATAFFDPVQGNWGAGWRIPFWISFLLVFISIAIRYSLHESPMFLKAKHNGKTSNPFIATFGNLYNIKWVSLALFGATMGQGCAWYTAQFYAFYYLQTVFKVPFFTASCIMGMALVLASPFFILFGYLSDKHGRKIFTMLGLALSLILYYPIYIGMYAYRYSNVATVATIAPAELVINPNYSPYMLCFLIWLQIIFVTMIYGPIAAFLVELFPVNIRYTSLSFPYHIGNGIFGGLVPVIGLILIKNTSNIYAGLWYPMGIIGATLLINILFIPETYENPIAVLTTAELTSQEIASDLPTPLAIKLLSKTGIIDRPKKN